MNIEKIYQINWRYFVLAILVSIFSTQALAATMSGTVADEITKLRINDVNVTAYKWNSLLPGWQYAGSATPNWEGDFVIPDLPTGTYYVQTISYYYNKHIGEYYDNTREWSKKTEILVKNDGDELILNSIELLPYPIVFEFLSMDKDQVPSSGGVVKLSGRLSNHTETPLSIYYWVNMSTNNDWIVNVGTVSVSLIPPTSIKLPKGETQFSLNIQIPANAPNRNDYRFEGIIGYSVWEPIAVAYFGNVLKGDDQTLKWDEDQDQAPSVEEEQRIPHRIDEDGTVLEWRNVP